MSQIEGNITVSVIMPTYNQASYLREAINSVREQSFKSWELIIVDNFSEDETEQVAAAFGDERIKYFKFKNNGVIAASRNYGVSKSIGQYLAFLDSDDWWYPKKLETVLKMKSKSNLVCHGYDIIRDNQIWNSTKYSEQLVNFKSLLIAGNPIATSTVMVDRKIFLDARGFDETPIIRTAEDYDLWIRISQLGATLKIIPDVLGVYRIHDSNSSSRLEQHASAVLKVVEKNKCLLESEFDQRKAISKTKSRLLVNKASASLRLGHFKVGLHAYLKAIWESPGNLSGWLGLIAALFPNSIRWRLIKFIRRISANCESSKKSKSEKIKVLVLGDGNSIHTERWIKGLMLNPNLELYLISMNPEGIRQGILNLNLKCSEVIAPSKIDIKGGNWRYLSKFLEIRKRIKQLSPDSINALYLTSYGLLGALFKGNAKLCHFLMGTDVMITPHKNIIYKLLAKFSVSRGDILVSSSKTMTDKLMTLNPCPSSKILTQQYGVPKALLDKTIVSKKYELVSNRAWVANSQILNLLNIIKLTKGINKLALVGSGSTQLANEIMQKANSLDNVEILGNLPYEENLKSVANSKFYISIPISDGASLSVLEAMALGSIPILSDITPNKEIVEDGVNGFLIDANDIENSAKRISEILKSSPEVIGTMVQYNQNLIMSKWCFEINMGRVASAVENACKNVDGVL